MTQIEKLSKFREIISKYKGGEYLNSYDFIICLELFKNHPFWKIKEGVGVSKIQVVTNSWKQKAFEIIKVDGSRTDISFIIASRGYIDSDIKRIKNACRYAIGPTIMKFRDSISWGTQKCPITNVILTKDNTHIDHYNLTFENLFQKWIERYDIIFLKNNLSDSSQDNVVYDYFINPTIISNFLEFHNNNTNLRAVSIQANLRAVSIQANLSDLKRSKK